MFLRTILALTLPIIAVNISQVAAGNPSEPDFSIEQEDTTIDLFYDDINPIVFTSDYIRTIKVDRVVMVPDMSWPTDGKEISSGFGYRQILSCSRCSNYHKALDFSREIGTPVYAAMDGIISRIEDSGEYGLHIYIEHIAVINNKTEKWVTVYAHLKRESIPDAVIVGSLINSGEKIAEIGETGLATGPHLHFELRVEDEMVDPEKYLVMYAN